MAKPPLKKSPLAVATVSIEQSQLEWLNKNRYDLSALVRKYLQEFISSMEKIKAGIAVPAIVKVPDTETLKQRLRKNPRLRHLVDDEE